MQQSCHRRWVSTTFPQPPKGRDTGENWATGWQKNAEWENRRKLTKTCTHRFKHLCGFSVLVLRSGLFRHRKNQSEMAVLRFLPFG